MNAGDELLARLLGFEMELREIAHERQLRGPERRSSARVLDKHERFVQARIARAEHAMDILSARSAQPVSDLAEQHDQVLELAGLEPALAAGQDDGEM